MHAPQTEADQLSGPSIHVHPVVTVRGAKRSHPIRPHTPTPSTRHRHQPTAAHQNPAQQRPAQR